MKRALRIGQPLIITLSLVFIGALLYHQADELQRWYRSGIRVHWGWLALSALLLLATWLMEIGVWRHLLYIVDGRRKAGQLSFVAAARIWFLSAIVRHVPGNIWQPLSMTVYCQQWGYQPEATVMSVALYQVLILLAVVPVAAVYFPLTGNYGLLADFLAGVGPYLLLLALLPVLAFVLRPQWLLATLNWALRKVGRPPLAAALSSGQICTLLTLLIFNWFLWGTAFATLTFALVPLPPNEMSRLAPHLIASYPMAYAVGFLSFITPGGLGVREGAFYVLLVPLMDGGVVTVAALAMRLWTTLGEVVMAGLSVLLGRFITLTPPVELSPAPLENTAPSEA